jgi:hypothetical protein
VSPVAIVWPSPLAADAYAAAGRDLGFPRPDCPSSAGPLVFWPGYRRVMSGGGPSIGLRQALPGIAEPQAVDILIAAVILIGLGVLARPPGLSVPVSRGLRFQCDNRQITPQLGPLLPGHYLAICRIQRQQVPGRRPQRRIVGAPSQMRSQQPTRP